MNQPSTPDPRLAQLEAAKRARVAAHNRRIRSRIPLYTKAILALKAEVVGGRDPASAWVKELAPLTREERELCRSEVVKRHTGQEASAS